jgi:Arc/MetJ-type ribon-helix-helix transcriptional regulator
MTSLQIELPDKLAEEVQRLVQSGWFETEQEIIRLALIDFIRRHEAALTEQFQLEDVSWAVKQTQAEQPQK